MYMCIYIYIHIRIYIYTYIDRYICVNTLFWRLKYSWDDTFPMQPQQALTLYIPTAAEYPSSNI